VISTPATGFDYLDAVLDVPGSVLAMAHRGGAEHPELIGLENTRHAFAHAAALGYRYLETDVHATRDGVVVAFHDEHLDRVTDRTGAIADLSAAEVGRARIEVHHPVPVMADLLEEFPGHRFNIDLKSHGAVAPLADLLARTGSESRVCVGSFSLSRLRRFRRLTGGRVATSAAPAEVVAFMALPLPGLVRLVTRDHVSALQVPARRGRHRIVDAALVRRAHLAGAHVHVWTVDDPAEMIELLDLGVDGLITDRTDLLREVLLGRGQWHAGAGS
jgi:glycerophosphoryl diester phosphodiesterase